MKLANMAWRNIWRNKRRTLITQSSLAFGVLLATLSTAISDWQWGNSIDKAARFGSGHLAVQHPAFLETPSLEHTLVADERLLRTLNIDGVDRVVPRITGQAVLSTAQDSYGVAFLGVDPRLDDAQTLSALGSIVSGNVFAPDDLEGIVLGQKLAENLSAGLGKKVVYTLTNKDGDIVSGLARVRGIVKMGSSIDASLCLLPMQAVRNLLGYAPNEVTQIAVYLRDQRRSRAVAEQLAPLVAPQAARSWQQLSPDLDGFITIKVVGSNVIQAFIILLIAAGIFNTLFVSVMERAREFGILLAVGFAPLRLFVLVLWESLWIALTGLAAGVLLTAPFYYRFATTGIDISKQLGAGNAEVAGTVLDPIIYTHIYLDHAVIIALAIVFVTLLAGLFPAWRATRVQPVEAIRMT